MNIKTIKKGKSMIALLLSIMTLFMSGITALADGVDGESIDKPYLSLGADLKEEEKAIVLDLLGLSDTDLSGYDVITITNEDEHNYLGEYLAANVIGSRALSSVLVEKQEAGHGVVVTTKNISYCTTGMYRNALLTAGITDAEIIVAGPFSITGTAALVGAMKAYEVMTGEPISQESMDAATNELVVTGEIAENTGDSQKVEELIALVKQAVLENNLATKDDIRDAINEASRSLEINLSDEDIEKIVSLMDKINDLDLDIESLKNQAKELYDKLADIEIDTEGLSSTIGEKLAGFFEAIVNFIKGLFG